MPPFCRPVGAAFAALLLALLLLCALEPVGSAVAIATTDDAVIKKSVFVVADWGGIGDSPYVTPYELTTAAAMNQMAVRLAAASSASVELVLALGDNFYSDGVKSVEDERFRDTFEAVFDGKPLLATPWYLVAGNHDWRGNVSAQILYSKLSKRWNFPDYFHTKVVQLDGGQCAAFILVDTVLLSGESAASVAPDEFVADRDEFWRPRVDGLSLDKHYEWLERQLILYQDCSYLFVAGHHPVWSIGRHGPTPELVKRLNPLLMKYGVSAYLSGHEHNLQHLLLNGTNYFVAGAAAHVTTSTAHKRLFPPEAVRYYWNRARDLEGAFMVLSFGRGHANASFVEAGQRAELLYTARLESRPGAAANSADDERL